MNFFDEISGEVIPGFGIGHATDSDAGTGVSVVVCKEGAACSCDIRGGGPATRETDLLQPEKMVEKVHAIVLSGGSALGLDASCGVAKVLREEGFGFRVGEEVVPIVPAACIYDLNFATNKIPDQDMAIEACVAALANAETKIVPETGCVGAGAGACVGFRSIPGYTPMKSGIGYSVVKFGKVKVAALTVVNALGNVYNDDGTFLAGVSNPKKMKNAFKLMNMKNKLDAVTNTTLSVVMTNAKFTKTECKKIATCANDGFARAINPVHTQNDGDSIFVMSKGKIRADVDVVSTMAAEVVANSIRDAVKSAVSCHGLTGLAG
ncbi:MAG: P1 family peptidase [Phoenicibacter congonensis]|uniref:P1 family peptidase n=1 Tax=Phoenicibacter congonensis TaxID=1944646 RepID=A0AA43RI51_9ACTN|nr:P1 family peptidase [Phoenicibacter congonensis]